VNLWDRIHLGSPEMLYPAAGGLIAALLVLALAYSKVSAPSRVRYTAALLKTAGFVMLAIFLLEPMWTSRRAKPGENVLIILADNSQSLQLHDRNAGASRADQLKKILADKKAGWLRDAEEQFDVRRYYFDTRLHSTNDFSDMDYKGRQSLLMGHLRELTERYSHRKVAGIVVFTDGNATDWHGEGDAGQDLASLYPVLIGSKTPPKDVSITSLTDKSTLFEDTPVMVNAQVASHGQDVPVVAQLFDDKGKMLEQRIEEPRSDGQPINMEFKLKPKRAGVHFYRLHTGSKNPDETQTAPIVEGEATQLNNTRWIMVDRGKGPYRILYVSGRPNWEYKFLHRAMATDTQIQMSGLIRIAKREAKFSWRGPKGDRDNPLFKGFDQKDDATERYDKPVLIPLDVKDGEELRDGFPKTAEELYKFHALIIDDLEASFFTREQMFLIQNFVTKRGGAFLMLGGLESFKQGGYQRTPIEQILPVYLDQGSRSVGGSKYRLKWTKLGEFEQWTRLRSTRSEHQKRTAVMPEFKTFNRLQGIKPIAMLMATVTDQNNKTWPALAVQEVGRGRSGAVMVGDLWRWHLRRQDTEQEDMSQLWRQTMRWMVANTPLRVEVDQLWRRDLPNSPLEISVLARDAEYQPIDNAKVKMRIDIPKGDSVTIDLQRGKQPGTYRTTYLPRIPGPYHATVFIDLGPKIPHLQRNIGWVSETARTEFDALTPNTDLMTQLASKTGGQLIDINGLGALIGNLPSKKDLVMSTMTTPLWHRWWMLAVALFCLAGEWGLRRVKGLP
jgi:uncharacterized membrane protein